MSVAVYYSYQAEADLDAVLDYLLSFSTVEASLSTMDNISSEIQSLADNLLISGVKVEGLPKNYRKWMIHSKRYWVYFVHADNIFQVLRVWPTRQVPLTPNQIRP